MYITHPLIKPDKVRLRKYQEKVVATNKQPPALQHQRAFEYIDFCY